VAYSFTEYFLLSFEFVVAVLRLGNWIVMGWY